MQITLAGGCFWCLVKPFHKITGVVSVVSGYSGGHVENPTYEQVCTNTTGHKEAVQIEYDPNIVSLETIIHHYFKTFDPTDRYGQFFDRGESYQPAIFYNNDEELLLIQTIIKEIDEKQIFDKPIDIEFLPFINFYPAESHHQDYYLKNPTHYEGYYQGSGRKAFIEAHWGDLNA